uniref:DUF753 domain-containing protein n=1 Tax=Phlebotomus papatasi TaxID=29031 RepID=A0A1B0CYG4_PHLPP
MSGKSIYLLLLCFAPFFGVNGQTQCIICSSRVNPECATTVDISYLSANCPNDNECATLIESNRYTMRGCASEVTNYCVNAVPLCSMCIGGNCNDRIFPLDRQICYQCVGSGCETPNETNLRPCEIYQENDGCFVAVEQTEGGSLTTYRGCTSDPVYSPAKQGCSAVGGYCIECDGSGCNTAPQSTQSTLSCVQCDSDDDYCSSPPGEIAQPCTHEVPLGRTDQCYTYRLGQGRVERGCLLDPATPSEYIQDCAEDNENCMVCSTPGCNIQPAIEPIQCIVCDESQDPDCRDLLNHHQPQQCPPGTYDAHGCYRYESNLEHNVIRGCVSDLIGTPRLNDCQMGGICKICDFDNCNSKVNFQECYSCNSGVETDCLRVQNNTRPTAICHEYMDTCAQIIQDGTRLTIRGCTHEVDAIHTHLHPFRQTCNANLCNSAIYPGFRAVCHQCADGPGCDRNGTETPEYLLPCRIFFQDDQCYSVLRNQQAVRGCISDTDANSAFCEASGELCERCVEGQGCNFRPASRPSNINCVSCQGDPACAWGFPNPTGPLCQETVWMGQRESCYVGVSPNDQVVRGCTLDPVLGCPQDHTCTHCYANNCNNVAVTRQQCIHCRSNAPGQASCAESAEDLEPRACSGDFQTFASRGCYTMRKPNNIVIRGCIRDLSYDDYHNYCSFDEEESDFCVKCLDHGCNVQPAPAKAALNHPLTFIIALIC